MIKIISWKIGCILKRGTKILRFSIRTQSSYLAKYWILIGWFQADSVQSFLPIILMKRKFCLSSLGININFSSIVFSPKKPEDSIALLKEGGGAVTNPCARIYLRCLKTPIHWLHRGHFSCHSFRTYYYYRSVFIFVLWKRKKKDQTTAWEPWVSRD